MQGAPSEFPPQVDCIVVDVVVVVEVVEFVEVVVVVEVVVGRVVVDRFVVGSGSQNSQSG